MSLVLENVSQGYGRSVVIDQLTLSFKPCITGLLGPNGAGKTTLLRTMATVTAPWAGSIKLGDLHVRNERTARRARNQIGYLPQGFSYEPGMSLLDFVRYAAWARGIPARDWDDAAQAALAHVDLIEHRKTKLGKLSGGMRQRAGIAWAIVGEPRLILLDEPTVGLDPRQRLQFRKILAGMKDAILVLSTHLIEDIDAVCERVVVMHNGSVRFHGTKDELEMMARPELPGNSPLERAYMGLLPAEEQIL